MKSTPSDEQTSDNIKQNINNGEVKNDVDPINTSPSRDSYTDLSSPKHSPFRQSLEEEHRAKARLRELEIEKLHNSKQLLRESIHSLSNAGAAGIGGVVKGTASDIHQHDSILTKTEHNFLATLLENGTAEACMMAHERLMDGNLFFAVCGGAAGEVHDLIPGHGWEVKSVAKTDDNEQSQQDDNNGDWVKDWVSRGSQDSINSKETSSKGDVDKVEKETPKVTNKKSTTSHTSSNASNSTKELTRPYELQRRVSSAARLSRLELRKQQSSVGSDSNRLFRAHEKGLTITPSGSSRRTLMRMGLPMERGLQRLHAPLDKPLKDPTKENEQEDPNTMLLSSQTEANGNTTIEKSTFQKALAHMDERTIRRIEKEERAKQKEKLTLERSVTPHNGGGCISPFSMSILQHMFTSKQLSFKRSSSSYSRFDSFLNTPADTDIDESTVGLDGINGDAADDIFRSSPRPSSTANRLKHLLVNAGFKSKMDDVVDSDHIVDAGDDDNAEILSTSTNSVAALLNGGHSFRNVDMFRESSADKKVEKKKPKSNDDTEEKPSSDDVPGTPTDVKKTHSEEVEVSPAASDLGELPSQLPPLAGRSRSGMSQSSLTQQRRGTAIGIMKTSSSSGGSPMRRGKYERSVSWNHAVFEKEEEKLAMARRDSAISLLSDGISVISFPNLKRAAPLRSESMSSVASLTLRPGRPVRSDSVASISSILSPFPSIGLGRPVLSSTGGTSFTGSLPSLSRARPVRSESQITMLTTDLDDDSLNSEDYVDVKPNQPNGAAWQSPLRPPRNPSSSVGGAKDEQAVFIRQASSNNYEGEGMEVEESPVVESVDKARKYRSMLSGSSFKSSKSSSSSRPLLSLDDSFVIRNISLSRHTLEILRSLSNEDLYSSHHLETINGTGSSSRGNEVSSVARVGADQVNCDESWDLDSTSYAAANAWNVTEDPYAEGYGAFNSLPFQILGTHANDTSCHPHVLSPPLMESLQMFMPETIAETNYFLKYSLVRDGAHLPSLLKTIRGTKHTLIAIETVEGEVFGSFTSSPWRKSWNYYGSGESFLWRMRRTRSEKDAQHSILDQAKLESELDVFYWARTNDMVQYCTHDMIALGGGTLNGDEGRDDQSDDQRNVSPTQSPTVDKGGFGLCLESDLLYGTSSPCATFQSPPLSRSHEDGSPFEILNIEVWTMSSMFSVEAAEDLEMKSLFLESYTRE